MALRWLLRYFLFGVRTLRSYGSGSKKPNFRTMYSSYRVKVKVLVRKTTQGVIHGNGHACSRGDHLPLLILALRWRHVNMVNITGVQELNSSASNCYSLDIVLDR